MPNEIVLPDQLLKAARDIEDRFRLLNIPIEKCPQKDWDALPADIRNLIPDWIPVLLSSFGLASGWLELPNHRDTSIHNLFGFLSPEGLELFLKPGSEYRDLIKFGLFPFAYEEGSGSVWVVKISDGAEGNIFLLEHTGWDGTEPTSKNGLVNPHKNLASFLAAVMVSDLN